MLMRLYSGSLADPELQSRGTNFFRNFFYHFLRAFLKIFLHFSPKNVHLFSQNFLRPFFFFFFFFPPKIFFFSPKIFVPPFFFFFFLVIDLFHGRIGPPWIRTSRGA